MAVTKREMEHYPTYIRIALCLSALFFLLFVVNILLGKFSSTIGMISALQLASVPEFFLLLSAVVFFVISSLAAEKFKKSSQPTETAPIDEEKDHGKEE